MANTQKKVPTMKGAINNRIVEAMEIVTGKKKPSKSTKVVRKGKRIDISFK